MEALGLIVVIIIIGIVLAMGMSVLVGIFGPIIFILLRFFPFIVGIFGGVIIWFTWDRNLGNFLVVAGIIAGILWERHIKKSGCNCVIHKIIDFLD